MLLPIVNPGPVSWNDSLISFLCTFAWPDCTALIALSYIARASGGIAAGSS
jgi:hypothetical protein